MAPSLSVCFHPEYSSFHFWWLSVYLLGPFVIGPQHISRNHRNKSGGKHERDQSNEPERAEMESISVLPPTLLHALQGICPTYSYQSSSLILLLSNTAGK